MLPVAFKLLYGFNTLFLGGQLLSSQLLHAKQNGIFLDPMNGLHFLLIALNFLADLDLKSLPQLIKLLQYLEFLALHISSLDLLEHPVSAVNVRLSKLRIINLIVVILLRIFLVV